MKILLVDDEELFISALAERLQIRGMDADWVCNAADAIKKAQNTKYDLALLDVKMPVMGGIELLRKLRTIAPSMKFILLTGHGSAEDFKIGSSEASYYLFKPMQIEDVQNAIYMTLEHDNQKMHELVSSD